MRKDGFESRIFKCAPRTILRLRDAGEEIGLQTGDSCGVIVAGRGRGGGCLGAGQGGEGAEGKEQEGADHSKAGAKERRGCAFRTTRACIRGF